MIPVRDGENKESVPPPPRDNGTVPNSWAATLGVTIGVAAIGPLEAEKNKRSHMRLKQKP